MVSARYFSNIVNIWDLETSTISSLVSKGDLDGVSDGIADLYADALVPLMQLALETKDNDLLLCAISHASEFSRQWLLMGEDHNSTGMTVDGVEIDPGADSPFITSAKAVISNFTNLATTLYTNNTLKSCDQSGDPFVGLNLLTLARQLVLFGGDESGANELVNAALNSCPPKLELDFSSTMTGTYQYAVGDVTDSFNFSGEISSQLPLQLNITQNSISSLQDLNADFTIPVGVSGSAPETYSNVTLSGAVTAPNFSCSASLAGATPSTLTVKPGTGTQTSQIEFQVASKYDPRLVALGGTALCSFCPIYEKTPFRVELLVIRARHRSLTQHVAALARRLNGWRFGRLSISLPAGIRSTLRIGYFRDLMENSPKKILRYLYPYLRARSVFKGPRTPH